MKRLVLDTCFAACSVALITPQQQWAQYQQMPRGHAEALLPMIRKVMNEAGTTFTDLDEIVVTTGPGTFTGMRVGIAAARAMALAANTAIAGLETLQLMAWSALRLLQDSDAQQDLVAAGALALAVDARRDQIYFQLFNTAGQALNQPQILSPDEALTTLRTDKTIAVGTGAKALCIALRQIAPAPMREIEIIPALPNLQPDARDLGLHPLRASLDAQAIRPLYLRPADTKPQIGKTIARA